MANPKNSAVAERPVNENGATNEQPANATDVEQPTNVTPITPPVAEKTAAARKAELADQLAVLEKQAKKLTRTINVLGMSADDDDDPETTSEAVKEFTAELEKTNKRIESLKESIENVDKEEAMKAIAAPFLEKLNAVKISNSHLLPATVHIVDLEKMENDNKIAAQAAMAKIEMFAAFRKAAEGLDENIIANLPVIAVTRDGDNNVTFGFASKATRRVAASTDGKASGGARASSKIRRVVTCEERPDLVGMIVGKSDNAKYPSWQAVYEDLADTETRARMDKQSRNKHDWFCSAFKATTEAIDENGNPLPDAE